MDIHQYGQESGVEPTDISKLRFTKIKVLVQWELMSPICINTYPTVINNGNAGVHIRQDRCSSLGFHRQNLASLRFRPQIWDIHDLI